MADVEKAALPPGWAWAKLGDICDIVGGITVDAKRRGPGLVEVPYLRVANVQRGRLDLSLVKQIAVSQAQAERLRLCSGDVLLNEGGDRDKVGRGWVWEGQIENCIFQNHVFRARPRSESIQPRWLSHYLNEAARPYFLSGSKQTTNLASLSFKKVAATPVAVPPANEQRRLVEVIEALLGEVGDVEAAINRARGQMADYRTSLLHAACTGTLTADWRAANPHPAEDGPALLRRILAERRAAWERAELARLTAAGKMPREGWKADYPEPRQPPETHQVAMPEGWSVATLDQLLGEPPRNGISVKGRSEPPGTPALRLDALGDDQIYYDRCRYIDIPARKAVALAIRAGDLLVSRANGSKRLVGRASLVAAAPARMVFPDTIIRCRLTLPELGPWIAMNWASAATRGQLERRAKTSAGIWKLGQDDLASVLIPLPPFPETDAALAQVAVAAIHPDEVPQGGTNDLRQAILHAAFSGRLVPQDPDDEPASDLLGRLRAEIAPPALHRRTVRTKGPRP